MIQIITPWWSGFECKDFNYLAFKRFQEKIENKVSINKYELPKPDWFKPYYVCAQNSTKKSPWKTRYGAYDIDGTFIITPLVEMYQCWKPSYGRIEHQYCNTVIVSDNQKEIRSIQSKLNRLFNKQGYIQESDIQNIVNEI